MGTDLAKTKPTTSSAALPIPAANTAADTLLRWARSGAYRRAGNVGRLQLVNVPTAAQRNVLRARWTDLRNHMQNMNNQIVVAALIELFGCYRNGLRAGEEPRTVALKYLRELDGLPTWAIVRACEQIRGGAFDELKTYPPSTIALRQIAKGYCEVPLTEMHQIAEVLQGEAAPEAISEAEKDRVHGLLRGLADELRATGGGQPIVTKAEAPRQYWTGQVSPELEAKIRGDHGAKQADHLP